MADKAHDIAELLSPTVQALGLELLGVEYLPSPGGAVLRLYIDRPGAEPLRGPVAEGEAAGQHVGIEDCEAVSREVSAQLDVEDPISGHYTLEVSSPGVDRPLFTAAQCARFLGEEAKVVLKLPMDGRRRFQGRIVAVDGEQVGFEIDAKPEPQRLTVDFDNIEKARLVPDWVALGYAPSKPGKGSKPGSGKPAARPAAKPGGKAKRPPDAG